MFSHWVLFCLLAAIIGVQSNDYVCHYMDNKYKKLSLPTVFVDAYLKQFCTDRLPCDDELTEDNLLMMNDCTTIVDPCPAACVETECQTFDCSVNCENKLPVCEPIDKPDGLPCTGGQCDNGLCLPSVDCVGSWIEGPGSCSAVCGGGVQVLTFNIAIEAAYGGAECEAFHGQTTTQACNLDPCCNTDQRNGFELISEVYIPDDSASNWDTAAEVPYITQNTMPDYMSRVGYCMQLTTDEWVWVSFDQTDKSLVGVPADFIFDEHVTNLNYASVGAGLTDTIGASGKVEFWHHCYTTSPGPTFNFDDSLTSTPDCYGSMQVHDATLGTLIAFNGWSHTSWCDVELGIGAGVHPDGTYNNNCADYPNAIIQTYVKEGVDVNCVGSWSDWSMCSEECGTGTQTQTYSITTPLEHGGDACLHLDGDVQHQSCNIQNCETECGTDCFGSEGCLTDGGLCVAYFCRGVDDTTCDCFGSEWESVTYDQWHGGWCSDINSNLQDVGGFHGWCGSTNMDCPAVTGHNSAWHVVKDDEVYYAGPSTSSQGTSCTNWNGLAFTANLHRISACVKMSP